MCKNKPKIDFRLFFFACGHPSGLFSAGPAPHVSLFNIYSLLYNTSMNQTFLNRIKQQLPKEYGTYLFLIICVYLLFTEELLAGRDILLNTYFRNLLPIPALILLLIELLYQPSRRRQLLPFVICACVFVFCGLFGWVLHRYQTFYITLTAMYEHLRFWLCLYLFTLLFRKIPLEQYKNRFFNHIAAISAVLAALSFWDFIVYIWPRQIYRWGIGSIQLFFGHPSNLGAKSIFLLAMLTLLYPYLKKDSGRAGIRCVLDLILSALMICVTLMTLRIRLFGLLAFFVILYVLMLVLKLRLNIFICAAGAAGAFFVGRGRLYNFYFSPFAYAQARGQFAINSLDIAYWNAPFGSGFATFGSRAAQVHYSPLYYKYNMMTIPGITPEHPNYACDTFYPCILGESGWMGFAAYFIMVVLLILIIFRTQKNTAASSAGLYPTFTALILVVYELLEGTGTLAFSEIYSVLIALALGMALAQCLKNHEKE